MSSQADAVWIRSSKGIAFAGLGAFLSRKPIIWDIDYELESLPFPPRVYQKEYLGINALGTVPFFTDGDTQMTESSAICLFLVEHYQRYYFGLQPTHPE